VLSYEQLAQQVKNRFPNLHDQAFLWNVGRGLVDLRWASGGNVAYVQSIDGIKGIVTEAGWREEPW
jgi:hypothetical protein